MYYRTTKPSLSSPVMAFQSPITISKDGRRISFASHKLEAPKKNRKKKMGCLGAFSKLD